MDLSLGNDASVDEITFEEGSLVFKAGDSSDFLYIIKQGEVVTFSADGGQIVPLYTLVNKGMLGDESAIHRDDYNYNAVATETTVAVKVASSDIKSYLNSAPAWVKNLMNLMCEKIVETEHIISEHKIRDDLLNQGQELAPEKLQMLTKALKEG